MQIAQTLPARVIKYYPETQTADLLICVEKVYSNIDEQQVLDTWQEVIQVPVQTISGGGFAITFPIKAGDTGKVSFSQTGYDHWFVNNKDEAGYLFEMPHPHLQRSFSLDDGFFEVGYNPLPITFDNVSEIDAVWRNKELTSYITIREDGSVEVNKDGSKIAIEVDGSISVEAPQINMVGDVNILGNLTHAGQLTRTLSTSKYGISPLDNTKTDTNTTP